MIFTNKKNFINIFVSVFFLIFAIMCLINPTEAAKGFFSGVKACYYKVIPSVFPFLIVTVIIFSSALSEWLGIIFLPYLKLLKINSRRCASAVALGFLGGFAVFCKAISQCLDTNDITTQNAEILLCLCINTGPAFIISGVGLFMFGSLKLGIYCFVSLCFAGFISTYITYLIFKKKLIQKQVYQANTLKQSICNTSFAQNFVTAVSSATTTCLTMCGYIAFFSTVCNILCSKYNVFSRIFAFILEVTTACNIISGSDTVYRVYICIAALSFCGLSIVFQSKAILPKQISFVPFFVSRLFHIPLSILIFKLLNVVFPISSKTVYISKVSMLRFAPDTEIVVVLMVLAMLLEITPKKLFTAKEK